jgi:predicted naringenin-chalcone synthase
MHPPVFINQFKKVLPPYSGPQSDLVTWTRQFHQAVALRSGTNSSDSIEKIEKYFSRFGIKESLISRRYSECNDFESTDFEKTKIYRCDDRHTAGLGIYEKGQFFLECTDRVFLEIYGSHLDDPHLSRPDHLIHVTCTGYVSPSSVQKLVAMPQWLKASQITHAYHMGCYASLPAIRIAAGLIAANATKNPDFFVDLVHTELCGLHMNPLDHSPEQIVVQTLFADGHMKYSASNQAAKKIGTNLKLIQVHEKIVPNSEKDMTWTPGALGMNMTLSREVPIKIKSSLKEFTQELYNLAGLHAGEGLNSVFAVHPGGPKIIDAVQEVFELRDDQLMESRKILYERGNMSSATLPHVWQQVLENQYPVGTYVTSYAFGPGLTLFGAVFQVQ